MSEGATGNFISKIKCPNLDESARAPFEQGIEPSLISFAMSHDKWQTGAPACAWHDGAAFSCDALGLLVYYDLLCLGTWEGAGSTSASVAECAHCRNTRAHVGAHTFDKRSGMYTESDSSRRRSDCRILRRDASPLKSYHFVPYS